jgi:hypothetical protein
MDPQLMAGFYAVDLDESDDEASAPSHWVCL